MNFTHRFDAERDLDIVSGPGLTLTVRRLGAEMIGLTRHHPRHGDIPLIWRNGELDDPPRFWKNHATLLFPIVGRTHGLRSRTTDGVEIHFERLHGFARHNRHQLLGAAGDERHFVLHYHLLDDEVMRAHYPWRFELWTTFELFADRLVQTMRVVNRDERDMPFQIGWHPGFNTPFLSGEKAACHLRLPRGPVVRRLNDPECYLTGETVAVDTSGDFAFTEKGLDGTYMFDCSAVDPAARFVELLDGDEAFGVRLRLHDHPHLGVWSDATAPFICLEPWQGMDDSVEQEPFDRKFGIVTLPPGAERAWRVTLETIEA